MLILLDPRFWLAAILLVGAAYAAGRWQQHRLDDLEHRADMVEALREQQTRYERRVSAQTEAVNEATKATALARRDARASHVAAERLRERLAEIAGQHPPTATSGAPDGATINVLADMLGKSVDRNRELAEHADAARIAGQACERSYDALTKN